MKRIESIDILRGFTLFGIILVHMAEQYYAGPFPEAVMKENPIWIGDAIASGFVTVFIIGKFYMIFSFLFGLSFFIQFSKSGTDTHFVLRFLWRLAILFAIGFIHHLNYRGDILTIYAMLGVTLVFLNRLSDRWILWISALLIFNAPATLVRAIAVFWESDPVGDTSAETYQASLMAYYTAIKSGTYIDILTANLRAFIGKMQFQVSSGRLFITLGLFMLGIYAGRTAFFENLQHKVNLLKKYRNYGWIGVGVTILSTALLAGIIFQLNLELSSSLQQLIGRILFDVFNASLATVYVMWILLWLQKEKWKNRLSFLYPVGRMGLTIYLMQTLFGTLIFFSYGFSLLSEIGALTCLGLAVVLFALQCAFARWWFRHFRFGPVEWLWRSLTYLRIQPMRLSGVPVS